MIYDSDFPGFATTEQAAPRAQAVRWRLRPEVTDGVLTGQDLVALPHDERADRQDAALGALYYATAREVRHVVERLPEGDRSLAFWRQLLLERLAREGWPNTYALDPASHLARRLALVVDGQPRGDDLANLDAIQLIGRTLALLTDLQTFFDSFFDGTVERDERWAHNIAYGEHSNFAFGFRYPIRGWIEDLGVLRAEWQEATA